MPVGDNTPYNVNRKVATFSDYCDNLPSEKEELDKIKRTTTKNDSEMKQVPGNRTHKFNKVTRKIDDLSPAEVNDKIDSIEEIEESKVNENVEFGTEKETAFKIANHLSEQGWGIELSRDEFESLWNEFKG